MSTLITDTGKGEGRGVLLREKMDDSGGKS